MQVERERDFGPEYSGARVSNTWIICLMNRDNISKEVLIPDKPTASTDAAGKGGLFLKASAIR